MAKRYLFLLRHARTLEKSSGEQDIDRRLTAIGLQNSTRMGINFLKKGYQFDQIFCSTAVRASTTAELVAEQLKYDTGSIYYNDQIYEASVRNLLEVVNHFKDNWKNVLLVGHNPAISYLGEYVSGSEIGSITTCSVLHIEFENMKWEEVGENSGRLLSYEYPDLLNF